MSEIARSGKTYIIRFSINGKRMKVYTGLHNKRVVERLAKRIDELKVSILTTGLTSEQILWAQELHREYPKIFDRLKTLGLLDEVKTRKDITLMEAMDRFFALRQDTIQTCSGPLRMAWHYVFTVIGDNTLVTSITQDDTIRIVKAISEHKVNGIKPCKDSTRSVYLCKVASIGLFLERHEYVTRSPLSKLGEAVHIDRGSDRYVPVEFVLQLLKAPSPIPKKLAVALGRFAGLRGVSEIGGLCWEHITWSTKDTIGTLRVYGKKTKHYDMLPISPALETLLRTYWELRGYPTEGHLFTYTGGKWPLYAVREIYAINGIEEPPRIWYNLRRSYCCDVMENCHGDPRVYEALARHNFSIGMEYYQMMHGGREKKVADVFLSPDSPLSQSFD